MWRVHVSQNVLKLGSSELFPTFCFLLALNGVYRFFVEVSFSRIFDTIHALRFIVILYIYVIYIVIGSDVVI
jgi:hypothetical protein